ncbi:exodeoxyribonuclease VII small subunit [Olegusella massiliensis]|uniref:exodeoxyribonuclease VII small subunit n=1 Tax=Olegusella massiliensis TaxID=1776381 RepID=UPI0003AE5BE6|nr:exodeoxyribonuclease VII small subunit [Olegusella massiliensis]ERL12201.1 exodeoxyribonuclease VII, small subunit [Coriobacteriaceae bacterium BV3Ac1]MBS5865848.1 exodeoxyribonuclease VII small subunit [Coriobacteriaceae bacterium]
MAEDKKIEELSFKEASVELEQIVRALEAGDLELEDALARYSRGVELLADLRKRLAHAEQRVEVLLASDQTTTTDTTAAPATAFLNED